jgi:predicted nucleic acid-binding protein
VIVHLDTSALVDAVAGERRGYRQLAAIVQADHRLAISTIALYEWLRGPRTARELVSQTELLPPDAVVAFGPESAARAASLYRAVRRPRGRDLDLAIAACAIEHDAVLWTASTRDFDDIPGLRLL